MVSPSPRRPGPLAGSRAGASAPRQGSAATRGHPALTPAPKAVLQDLQRGRRLQAGQDFWACSPGTFCAAEAGGQEAGGVRTLSQYTSKGCCATQQPGARLRPPALRWPGAPPPSADAAAASRCRPRAAAGRCGRLSGSQRASCAAGAPASGARAAASLARRLSCSRLDFAKFRALRAAGHARLGCGLGGEQGRLRASV